MAKVFLSYSIRDGLNLARQIEEGLIRKGHRISIPVNFSVAGNWRNKLTKGLITSDALIAVLTPEALKSRYVLGEIGTGRAMEHSKQMLLIPVLAEPMPIPEFLSDVFCFRLSKGGMGRLVQELDKAICDNMRLTPRIFISHRHKDQAMAKALIELLETAFVIRSADIRCTSVQGYMLTPGERTSEELRSNLAGAELVIGLLSPGTNESNYVLAELGAAWGQNVTTFPLLVRGATYADVPSPLNERHCVSLESRENCLDLIESVDMKTTLKRRTGVPLARLEKAAKALAAVAKSDVGRAAKTR
jgi:TIR domain